MKREREEVEEEMLVHMTESSEMKREEEEKEEERVERS